MRMSMAQAMTNLWRNDKGHVKRLREAEAMLLQAHFSPQVRLNPHPNEPF